MMLAACRFHFEERTDSGAGDAATDARDDVLPVRS